MPQVAAASPEAELEAPLVEVRGLSKSFPVHGGLFGGVVSRVQAVDDVSFAIHRGETLGLVGESGCGKTTLGRLVLRLLEPSLGSVHFGGQNLLQLGRPALRVLRRRMQIVFQDPYSSLNPRHTVGDAIGEPLSAHGLARGAALERRVSELLERVGLPTGDRNRFPHEFSGGQRQRVCIARALALGPEFIVLDEAVSALDLSVQAQILNLLRELQDDYQLTYLFISHNLSVVRHIADRVAVMYLGQLVELGDARELFESPLHPYTRALIAANPVPDPDVPIQSVPLVGEPPSRLEPPTGCRFHPRCPNAFGPCASDAPAFRAARVRCHLYDDATNSA